MRNRFEDVLYQLFCGLAGCGKMFYICRRCYRGHKYCSSTCRAIARRRQMHSARLRYRRTPEARLDQRDRQRRWRQRRSQKTVMDQCSPPKENPPPSDGRERSMQPLSTWVEVVLERKTGSSHVSGVPRCVICGRAGGFVNPFYLRRSRRT